MADLLHFLFEYSTKVKKVIYYQRKKMWEDIQFQNIAGSKDDLTLSSGGKWIG